MKEPDGQPIPLKQGKAYKITPMRMKAYKLPLFDMSMGMECLSLTHVEHAPPTEIMATELTYYGSAGKWSWLEALLDDDLLEEAELVEFFICKSRNDPTGPWHLTCIKRSGEDGDMDIILTEKP